MPSRSDSRIIRFRSEQSLAAFLRELPKDHTFECEEDPAKAGHYILYLD